MNYALTGKQRKAAKASLKAKAAFKTNKDNYAARAESKEAVLVYKIDGLSLLRLSTTTIVNRGCSLALN